MYNRIIVSFATYIVASTTIISPAIASERVVVRPFATEQFVTVPDGVKYPEGITSNPATGEVYVATFNVPNVDYNPSPVNSILRYSEHGQLLARSDFSGPTPLVGIKYNPHDDHIYMASLGDISGVGSKILKIDADFTSKTATEVVADIPFAGAPQDRVVPNIDGSTQNISFNTYVRMPNDIIFDSEGDLYVSDSFQGAVFTLSDVANCVAPCQLETVIHDGMLATAGFPSFGANGLALNQDESKLYIANTGDDRILSLDLSGETGLSVFAESVNGADGIAFDPAGNLWITANQADNLVALNPQGKVIAQLGSNLGLRFNGAPRGLLFPASLDIIGNKILVTNMAQVATPMIGDETEENVTRYTISEIKIPFSIRASF